MVIFCSWTSIDHQCLLMWDRCSYSYVFAFFTDVIIQSVRVVGEQLKIMSTVAAPCYRFFSALMRMLNDHMHFLLCKLQSGRWRHHSVMFTRKFQEYNHVLFRSSRVTVSLLDHFCVHPCASAIGSQSQRTSKTSKFKPRSKVNH